jgi:hypothetical protein
MAMIDDNNQTAKMGKLHAQILEETMPKLP